MNQSTLRAASELSTDPSVDNGVGSVSLTGSTMVSPSIGTHTYTLFVADGGVGTACTATLSVKNLGNGPIVGSSFSAPTPIIPQAPASTTSAAATTPSTTQSLIDTLRAQIQVLLTKLAQLKGAPNVSAVASMSVFTRDLELGDTGADVKALQQYLNTNGYSVASNGAGSFGRETTKFGVATYRALKKFQSAHNLPSTGYFGPLTRALITSTR